MQPPCQTSAPNPHWQCFFPWQSKPGCLFWARLEINWWGCIGCFSLQTGLRQSFQIPEHMNLVPIPAWRLINNYCKQKELDVMISLWMGDQGHNHSLLTPLQSLDLQCTLHRNRGIFFPRFSGWGPGSFGCRATWLLPTYFLPFFINKSQTYLAFPWSWEKHGLNIFLKGQNKLLPLPGKRKEVRKKKKDEKGEGGGEKRQERGNDQKGYCYVLEDLKYIFFSILKICPHILILPTA